MIKIITATLSFVLAMTLPSFALSGHFDGQGIYRFPYGTSTPPTLTCSPDKVCELVLQPNEQVFDKVAGDTVRWIIATGVAGGKGEIPTIFFKPIDVGNILDPISTNLIITTNLRTYNVILLAVREATRTQYGFYYPNPNATLTGLGTDDYLSQPSNPITPNLSSGTQPTQDLTQNVVQNSVPAGQSDLAVADATDTIPLPPQLYDFNYHWQGDDSSMYPQVVWNDGVHTYIKLLPRTMTPSISIYLQNDQRQAITPHPPINNVYSLDGIPDHIQLLYDTGKHGNVVDIFRGH